MKYLKLNGNASNFLDRLTVFAAIDNIAACDLCVNVTITTFLLRLKTAAIWLLLTVTPTHFPPRSQFILFTLNLLIGHFYYFEQLQNGKVPLKFMQLRENGQGWQCFEGGAAELIVKLTSLINQSICS